jgi:hypothetical protein
LRAPLKTLAVTKFRRRTFTERPCPDDHRFSARARNPRFARQPDERAQHRPRVTEAAAGDALGLVEEGDRIRIDISARTIDVLVEDAELRSREA